MLASEPSQVSQPFVVPEAEVPLGGACGPPVRKEVIVQRYCELDKEVKYDHQVHPLPQLSSALLFCALCVQTRGI